MRIATLLLMLMQVEMGPGAGMSVSSVTSSPVPVASVSILPAGSQSLSGTSVAVTVRPLPQGAGRDVKLYWKPNTAADASYALVGSATFNSGTGWYDITWTFPSCAVFPPGPPDNELATLKATAQGGDGVTQQAVNDSYALTGRGC